jgi:hypothetical protein
MTGIDRILCTHGRQEVSSDDEGKQWTAASLLRVGLGPLVFQAPCTLKDVALSRFPFVMCADKN